MMVSEGPAPRVADPARQPAATSGVQRQEVRMFTLAPRLFFAIFFGWAPWPYASTHPAPRDDGRAKEAPRKA